MPAAIWPANAQGFQPAPEAIAWGRVTQGSQAGQEFPVITAYDGHPAGVGRIVADSTWHHWFDINLVGFAANSPEEQEIYAYFRNVAIWLASPSLQGCMRRNVCWGALWLDPLVMISPQLHPFFLGPIARDAFGKYAPQCILRLWFLELFPLAVLRRLQPLFEQQVLGLDKLEDLVLAEVVQELRSRFPASELPKQPPDEALVEEVFEAAGQRALERLGVISREHADLIRRAIG